MGYIPDNFEQRITYEHRSKDLIDPRGRNTGRRFQIHDDRKLLLLFQKRKKKELFNQTTQTNQSKHRCFRDCVEMKNTEKGRGRKKEKIRIKIFNKLDERLLMLFPPAPLALSFIR